MARSHEDWIEVTSCQLGMENDTLVFEQGGTETPDGRQLVISIKGGPDADDGQLDFAAADSSEGVPGEPITFTVAIHTDTYLPAVQHDYDLS
jgi:hypothetical protein